MISPRVRILIPYFGKWPQWMPFFVESCRRNTAFSWLLFSDCGPIANCPPNIEVTETSFEAYRRTVSEALGIDFAAETPYKLCDIKPALGFIHQDAIRDVDFWGFGDIDVIYGDLESYFMPALERSDLVSTHRRRISGHLTLLRNTAKMRNAFRAVPAWADAFENPDHVAFDEKAFTRLFVKGKNFPAWFQTVVRTLRPYGRKACFREAFSTPCARIPWVDGTLTFPERWRWQDGVLTNDRDGKRQFPYLHFMHWKKQWPPFEENVDAHALRRSSWQISSSGISADPGTEKAVASN